MNEKKLLKIKINEETDIYIEESFISSQANVTRSHDRNNVLKSDKNLKELLSVIKPVSKLIFNSFSELNNPNTIEVEMGLKFGAKAGIVFASADSEATFKVKLKWDNKKTV